MKEEEENEEYFAFTGRMATEKTSGKEMPVALTFLQRLPRSFFVDVIGCRISFLLL